MKAAAVNIDMKIIKLITIELTSVAQNGHIIIMLSMF